MGTLKPTDDANRTLQILQAAESARYGIIACVCYEPTGMLALSRAATATQSPALLQLFPWAISFGGEHLVRLAADIAHSAPVPMALHLDHCDDPEVVQKAADIVHFDHSKQRLVPCFDSIMVDMSRYAKQENLRLTRELTAYCHARGIAVEAEPGRIEGGEDGLAGTEGLEGMLTTPEEVEEFLATGIDMLAPAVGNVHGSYGPSGPQLDWARLQKIKEVVNGRVRLVMHGTRGFSEDIVHKCIAGGVSKLNENSVIARPFADLMREKGGRVPLTELLEEAHATMQNKLEERMRFARSAGVAQ